MNSEARSSNPGPSPKRYEPLDQRMARAARKLAILAAAVALMVLAGRHFHAALHEREPVFPGPGVSRIVRLSDYFEGIRGTPVDTEVYILEGENPGGSLLVLAGTHPNEISGVLAGILIIEKARVTIGRLFVIPHANQSGFTSGHPGEAYPRRYHIRTDSGVRWFRFGDRWTNPVHQWPDPEAYTHYPSGQSLSGFDVRNLNRCFPGRPDGTLTEKLGYAVAELIRREQIDLTLDLHEAEPMYPIINTIVAHERSMDVGLMAAMNLAAFEEIQIGNEPSPVNLHGLSHRELGDHTDTLALLAETGNPIQDPSRGRTSERLILEGKDEFLLRAARQGLLFIPYDEEGLPIDRRVGRQTSTIQEIIRTYSDLFPERPIELQDLPDYAEVSERGVGYFLSGPPR